MSSPRTLSPFGVVHADAPEKVTRELESFADDADAIFLEYPERDVGFDEVLSAALRAPILLVGLLLYQALVLNTQYLLFNRDLLPTEVVALDRLTADHEKTVHRVDDPLIGRIARVGLPGAVLNWATLVSLVWVSPSTLETASLGLLAVLPVSLRHEYGRRVGIAAFLAWVGGLIAVAVAGRLSLPLLLVGFVAALVFVVGSVPDRNVFMLDRIEGHSEEHGYDDVVLVTGKGHLGGLVRLAGERAIDVPRVHVSEWRGAGNTLTEFVPADLPEVGGESNPRERAIVPGSETAVVGERAIAAGIDAVGGLVLGFLAGIALLVVAAIVAGSGFGEWTNASIIAAGTITFLFAWYYVLEASDGQTVGKRVTGLAVADADTGSVPSRRAVLVRTLVLPVDWLAWPVSALLIATSDRKQRLGDRLAGTVVGRRPEQSEAEEASDDERTPADRGREGAQEQDAGEVEGEPPAVE